MTAARRVAAGESSGVISLASRRQPRRAHPQRLMKAGAVFALCLLGLIGSFADSAIARTGLLLINAADDIDPGSLDGVTATLIWATIANLAACAGVVMVVYWMLSRPTAQVVELHARRRKS